VTTGHGTGSISKSVSVFTNAKGSGAMVTLQVRGELWQAIQATPTMASFGNVSASQIAEGSLVRKLTIVNNVDEPAKLTNIQSTNASFTAEVTELEPGRKFEMTVKLARPSASGVQAGSITMNTGLKEKPSLQIAVNAYILADVDVVPSKIMLPKDRTASIQRDFYVRNNSKKPIKLSEVRTSDPKLKVTMTETQPGMAFNLKLDVPADYKVPPGGDTITFNSDNPAYPVITVPVVEAPFPASNVNPQPVAQTAKPNTATPAIQPVAKPAPGPAPAKPAGHTEGPPPTGP